MPTSAYAVCTNPMPQESGVDACLHGAVGEGATTAVTSRQGRPTVAPQGRRLRASPRGT